MFTVILSGFVVLLNLAVPPARTEATFSNNVSFSLTCNPKFALKLSPFKNENQRCTFVKKNLELQTMEAKQCGYECPEKVVEYPVQLLKNVKKINLGQWLNSTLYHLCKIQADKDENDGSPPPPQKCFRKNINKTRLHENMPKSFKIHNVKVPLLDYSPNTEQIPLNEYTMNPKKDNLDFECKHGRIPKVISIPKIIIAEEASNMSRSNNPVTCHFHCQTTLPYKKACEKKSLSVEHDIAFTFWLFVTANVLSKLLVGLNLTLFEIAVVALLKELGHSYNLQKVYGSLGGMVLAPISGFLIDYFGKGNHYKDY